MCTLTNELEFSRFKITLALVSLTVEGCTRVILTVGQLSVTAEEFWTGTGMVRDLMGEATVMGAPRDAVPGMGDVLSPATIKPCVPDQHLLCNWGLGLTYNDCPVGKYLENIGEGWRIGRGKWS